MPGLIDEQPFAGALAAVDRILNREPEADEALRQIVTAICERIPTYTWVGLYFAEAQELTLGPWASARTAGDADPPAGAGSGPRFPWTASAIDVPVIYQGQVVGVLAVDSDTRSAFGDADRAFLERVAVLVSAHCLVGWDTGGVPWPDVV